MVHHQYHSSLISFCISFGLLHGLMVNAVLSAFISFRLVPGLCLMATTCAIGLVQGLVSLKLTGVGTTDGTMEGPPPPCESELPGPSTSSPRTRSTEGEVGIDFAPTIDICCASHYNRNVYAIENSGPKSCPTTMVTAEALSILPDFRAADLQLPVGGHPVILNGGGSSGSSSEDSGRHSVATTVCTNASTRPFGLAASSSSSSPEAIPAIRHQPKTLEALIAATTAFTSTAHLLPRPKPPQASLPPPLAAVDRNINLKNAENQTGVGGGEFSAIAAVLSGSSLGPHRVATGEAQMGGGYCSDAFNRPMMMPMQLTRSRKAEGMVTTTAGIVPGWDSVDDPSLTGAATSDEDERASPKSESVSSNPEIGYPALSSPSYASHSPLMMMPPTSEKLRRPLVTAAGPLLPVRFLVMDPDLAITLERPQQPAICALLRAMLAVEPVCCSNPNALKEMIREWAGQFQLVVFLTIRAQGQIDEYLQLIVEERDGAWGPNHPVSQPNWIAFLVILAEELPEEDCRLLVDGLFDVMLREPLQPTVVMDAVCATLCQC